jgi:hypothetical protein
MPALDVAIARQASSSATTTALATSHAFASTSTGGSECSARNEAAFCS